MKLYRLPALAVLLTMAMFVSSCGTSASVRGGGPTMAQAQAERYDGPKARLAVSKFVDKSAKGAGTLGNGMADMLTSELFRTNRFIILDRQDLDAVIDEQDLGASGRVSEETATVIGEIEGADLLVYGAITAFEPDHIGVGGAVIGILSLGASLAIASQNEDAPIGAVTYKESYVAMDIKIVDTATGRVVGMSSVEGRYKVMGGGVLGGVGGGWSRVPVMLGGFAGTAAEQAVRVCVEAAVRDVVSKTPAEYYRVKDTLDMTPAGLMTPVYPVTIENAAPSGAQAREARIIENQEGYEKLLADLNVDAAGAPSFDWSGTRLIATFGAEKENKGHAIGVIKAVHKKDYLEVTAREVAPPEGVKTEPGPDWPFSISRVENPGKPIKVVWVE